MEKDQKILIGIIVSIFIVAIGVGIFLYLKKDNNNISDALKFKNEYESYNGKTYDGTEIEYINLEIPKDNLFKYTPEKEVVDILQNKTALIYFGFAQCPYCRSMVNLLNDVAEKNNLEQIYYVDILNNRDTYEVIDNTVAKITNGSKYYYELLDVMKDYLTDYEIADESGKNYATGVKRLYAPTVVAVKNGKIVGFHEGTIDTVSKFEELTEEESKTLSKIYQEMIDKMEINICSSQGC